MFEGMTVKEIKTKFKQLIFELHPDRHPQREFAHWNTQTRQLLEAYHAALQNHHLTAYVGSDNKEHVYYYNRHVEEAVAKQIEALLKANLPSTVNIYIIGYYVWLDGTRREDVQTREKLKQCSMRWHSRRKKWYWKPKGMGKSRYNHKASFEDLMGYYGGRKVEQEREERSLEA